MNRRQTVDLIARGARIGFLLIGLSISLFAQGKNPVILIPGLSGSELRHKTTNERVWFRAVKSKSEDLRLPISADITSAHDDLIPTDVLRSIKLGIFPITDVYGGFINAMAVRGGYHEESWDKPSENGYQDSLYVYPYDWRLDNVGNARLLIRRIDALRLKLKKPDLKFDIVAHSMGGIIARYAAMYGDTDLIDSPGDSKPTWAGASYFDKIVLLGTPNEGSALSLSNLINGFMIGGMRIDLPFVQDTSKFMIFTIPAVYQLLPAPGTFRAYDDRLQPLEIDLYDPKVWSKYGWNPIDDKGFADAFDRNEQKVAGDYFAAALDRAKRLHLALSAAGGRTGGIGFYVVGADCRTALDSILVYRNSSDTKWITMFRPKGFTRADGQRVTEDELKKLMMSPGDGIVTSRSLEAVTQSARASQKSILGSESDKLICGEHNTLATNVRIQDHILSILSGKADRGKATADTGNNRPQTR